jgi:hypothetical protein
VVARKHSRDGLPAGRPDRPKSDERQAEPQPVDNERADARRRVADPNGDGQEGDEERARARERHRADEEAVDICLTWRASYDRDPNADQSVEWDATGEENEPEPDQDDGGDRNGPPQNVAERNGEKRHDDPEEDHRREQAQEDGETEQCGGWLRRAAGTCSGENAMKPEYRGNRHGLAALPRPSTNVAASVSIATQDARRAGRRRAVAHTTQEFAPPADAKQGLRGPSQSRARRPGLTVGAWKFSAARRLLHPVRTPAGCAPRAASRQVPGMR